MKRQIRRGMGWAGLLALLILFSGAFEPAQAQPAPPGSYLNTCRDVRVRNGRDLQALCETTRRGVFNATRLNNFFECRGDIANMDGRLWCERRPGPPPPPPPGPGPGNGPPGSYRATCGQIDQRGNTLNAVCRTRNGDWRPTRLDLFGCAPGGDIANDNGNLVCPPRPVPPGSYLQTCRNVRVAGFWLAADCRDMNGRWLDARLNLATCSPRPNVVNFNGTLICR
ncbi:CVNH domain-containing protein [Xanthobacter agilis]|uniref:CVNH domain-containing protein n=1 Tax=Xanthobacter agilis TaxID=47492 RepID=UPI003727DA91